MSDLSNLDTKIDYKDAALILSASLPLLYENYFIDFFPGRKDTLSLEEVKIKVLNREVHHKACSRFSYRGV